MEKETKKKNTTSTKKTTSAKKATTVSKQSKPATKTKKASNTKTVTKAVNDNKKEVATKNVATKKTNSETSKTVTNAGKKNNGKTLEIKVEEVKEVPVKKEKEVKKTATNKVEAKNKKETTLGEELKSFIKSDIGSLIGIVLIIILIMGGFFFITDFIKNLNKPEEELKFSQDIQYDEILLSNMLKQPESAYYVFIYDKGKENLDIKDIDVQTYEIYLGLYETQDDAERVYRADLTSKFNQLYYTDKESNLLISNVEDLKVNTTTLIKVENGVVVAAFDTRDSIVEFLNAIVK